MWPVLIIALVVVALAVGAYLFGRRPEPVRGRPVLPMLRRRSRVRRWLPILALLAAVACLVLAFTGFRLSRQSPAVILAIDVSKSMKAKDVAPNRLTAAKEAALVFLDEVPADFLVGLVTFSGEVSLRVPPTKDRDRVVAALGPLTTSPGTLIGDGLTRALQAIEDERRRRDEEVPGAVVLLSDGLDTRSKILPLDAAERAQEIAVPVYTVVLGRIGEANGGADPETMEQIAATSDGETFTAETAEELTRVYESLGSDLPVVDVEPFSTPLVIAAIVLVILAGLLAVLVPR